MNVRERIDELIRQHMPGLDLRHSVRLTTTGDVEGIMLTLAREVRDAASQVVGEPVDGCICMRCWYARAIEREVKL